MGQACSLRRAYILLENEDVNSEMFAGAQQRIRTAPSFLHLECLATFCPTTRCKDHRQP